MCQIREVVNQKLLPVHRAPPRGECCSPLAREPLSQAGADELAPLFKAVADPVRLRLLSLIACHDGGESCVCDLLDGVRRDRAVDQLPPEDPARGRADQLRAARHLGVSTGSTPT